MSQKRFVDVECVLMLLEGFNQRSFLSGRYHLLPKGSTFSIPNACVWSFNKTVGNLTHRNWPLRNRTGRREIFEI